MRCLVVMVAVLVVVQAVEGYEDDLYEDNREADSDEIVHYNSKSFVNDVAGSVNTTLSPLIKLVGDRVDAVKDEIHIVKTSVGEVKNDVDEVKATVNALKGVKVQIDAVELQVNAANDKVDAVKTEVDKIEELKNRVEEVQTTLIPGLTRELAQVKGQVDALGDTVARVLTQLGNVATINTLNTIKTNLTNEISDLRRDTLTALQDLIQDDSTATTLEDALANQSLQLTQTINEARKECSHAQSVPQLLDQAITTNDRLESLSRQLNSTQHTLASSCSQVCLLS